MPLANILLLKLFIRLCGALATGNMSIIQSAAGSCKQEAEKLQA